MDSLQEATFAVFYGDDPQEETHPSTIRRGGGVRSPTGLDSVTKEELNKRLKDRLAMVDPINFFDPNSKPGEYGIPSDSEQTSLTAGSSENEAQFGETLVATSEELWESAQQQQRMSLSSKRTKPKRSLGSPLLCSSKKGSQRTKSSNGSRPNTSKLNTPVLAPRLPTTAPSASEELGGGIHDINSNNNDDDDDMNETDDGEDSARSHSVTSEVADDEVKKPLVEINPRAVAAAATSFEERSSSSLGSDDDFDPDEQQIGGDFNDDLASSLRSSSPVASVSNSTNTNHPRAEEHPHPLVDTNTPTISVGAKKRPMTTNPTTTLDDDVLRSIEPLLHPSLICLSSGRKEWDSWPVASKYFDGSPITEDKKTPLSSHCVRQGGRDGTRREGYLVVVTPKMLEFVPALRDAFARALQNPKTGHRYETEEIAFEDYRTKRIEKKRFETAVVLLPPSVVTKAVEMMGGGGTSDGGGASQEVNFAEEVEVLSGGRITTVPMVPLLRRDEALVQEKKAKARARQEADQSLFDDLFAQKTGRKLPNMLPEVVLVWLKKADQLISNLKATAHEKGSSSEKARLEKVETKFRILYPKSMKEKWFLPPSKQRPTEKWATYNKDKQRRWKKKNHWLRIHSSNPKQQEPYESCKYALAQFIALLRNISSKFPRMGVITLDDIRQLEFDVDGEPWKPLCFHESNLTEEEREKVKDLRKRNSSSTTTAGGGGDSDEQEEEHDGRPGYFRMVTFSTYSDKPKEAFLELAKLSEEPLKDVLTGKRKNWSSVLASSSSEDDPMDFGKLLIELEHSPEDDLSPAASGTGQEVSGGVLATVDSSGSKKKQLPKPQASVVNSTKSTSSSKLAPPQSTPAETLQPPGLGGMSHSGSGGGASRGGQYHPNPSAAVPPPQQPAFGQYPSSGGGRGGMTHPLSSHHHLHHHGAGMVFQNPNAVPLGGAPALHGAGPYFPPGGAAPYPGGFVASQQQHQGAHHAMGGAASSGPGHPTTTSLAATRNGMPMAKSADGVYPRQQQQQPTRQPWVPGLPQQAFSSPVVRVGNEAGNLVGHTNSGGKQHPHGPAPIGPQGLPKGVNATARSLGHGGSANSAPIQPPAGSPGSHIASPPGGFNPNRLGPQSVPSTYMRTTSSGSGGRPLLAIPGPPPESPTALGAIGDKNDMVSGEKEFGIEGPGHSSADFSEDISLQTTGGFTAVGAGSGAGVSGSGSVSLQSSNTPATQQAFFDWKHSLPSGSQQ